MIYNLQFLFLISSCACLLVSVCADVVLPEVWEKGFPDGPEMDAFSLQVKQFLKDWESMEHTINCSYAVLDITNKTSEDILQEMNYHMKSM